MEIEEENIAPQKMCVAGSIVFGKSKDIWLLILKYLSASDIVSLERVCKEWNEVLKGRDVDAFVWKRIVLHSAKGSEMRSLVPELDRKKHGWRKIYAKLMCYEKNICSVCFRRFPARKHFYGWYLDDEDWSESDEEEFVEAKEKEKESLKLIAKGESMSMCMWKGFVISPRPDEVMVRNG